MSKDLHGDLVDVEEIREKLAKYAFVHSDITVDSFIQELEVVVPSTLEKSKENSKILNASKSVSDEELDIINMYHPHPLAREDIFVFSVVLCDNNIDKDYERFTVECLEKLSTMFLGKTGILETSFDSKNYTARIVSCKIEAVDDKRTILGDDYFRLVAKAYLPICEANKNIIASIENRTVTEVNIGCSVRSTVCSICGNDITSCNCPHIKGEIYDDEYCCGLLIEPAEVYEFSLVADAKKG